MLTKYQIALAAIKDLQTVGMSAQETHDLLEEVRDCVGRYDVSHAIKDAVFVCCDWIDEEQAEADSAAEEEKRIAQSRRYQCDEEALIQRYRGWEA